MIKSIKSLIAAITVSLFAATSLFSAECIAPANPGGGWDFTCRTITKIMYDIGAVDSPIQVTNMAGGGGGLLLLLLLQQLHDLHKMPTRV
jgi:putative tricarboxylic transport membrane protein